MATVVVDIDLDDIDTDDIIQEAIDRIQLAKKFRSQEKLKKFKELIKELAESEEGFPVKTLDDELKLEHLKSVFPKYTHAQIINLLPE